MQVGDKKLSKIVWNTKIYIKLMVFYKLLWWCPQVDNEFKEYENKINFKILRSWNLHPKPDSIICFWASLSMMSFQDPNLIVYFWIFNTTTKVIMEKTPNLNNTWLLLLGLWPKQSWFQYTIALFWSTLACLYPLAFLYLTQSLSYIYAMNKTNFR